jgi:hypothetical protein
MGPTASEASRIVTLESMVTAAALFIAGFGCGFGAAWGEASAAIPLTAINSAGARYFTTTAAADLLRRTISSLIASLTLGGDTVVAFVHDCN